MRALYIDIDSLRADRLGCYGYHRDTSPTIDALARQGIRVEHCFASDAPCLPSRTSLFSGQYGIRHGCVNHEGRRAERWRVPDRGFVDARDKETWPALLRQAGYRTHFISSFPTRHSAWHALAGFGSWDDPGGKGHELAPTVGEAASAWLQAHASEPDWFCHINFWDVHTPYRTPADYGEPFADDPPPAWPDPDMLARHAQQPGLRSARDSGWSKGRGGSGPRQPAEITSYEDLVAFQNGYDTGLRYIDDQIARLLEILSAQGVLEETAVIVTADHGEDIGEMGAYGGHCFVGPAVARVPVVMRWPGLGPELLTGLHQHFDIAATICELLGIEIPASWDAVSFLPAITGDSAAGRDLAVSSMLAQGIQRACYWQEQPGREPTAYVRTWNALSHPVPEEGIIDGYRTRERVPVRDHPLLEKGRGLLDQWTRSLSEASPRGDPLEEVLEDQTGPIRQTAKTYPKRLAETGRSPA
jgi:arylsulfatase A-like enzyme